MEEALRIAPGVGPTLQASLGMVTEPGAGLVLCHPHPLYGGDMDNPVIVRCAEVAREEGIATLRFNFRGVGESTGTHDDGRGEADDALAALAALGNRLPGRRVSLLGYSFGAAVVARLASGQVALPGLGLVAPPLAMLDLPRPGPRVGAVLLVAGTRDQYCPMPALERFAAPLPSAQVAGIEGADHFFSGKLFPMGEAVRGWIRRWAVLTPDGEAGAAGSPSPPRG